jgi:hypothetical protein
MPRLVMEIDEPWDFKGPDGTNKLPVEFVRTVTILNAPEQVAIYILLKLLTPFLDQGQPVEFVVAAPRYSGIKVEDILDKGSVVGLARVLPGKLQTSNPNLTLADIVHAYIGWLGPIQAL